MEIEEIIRCQRGNNRPSIHGKILNNYYGSKNEEYVLKGYMRKRDNTYRDNCYLTTPFVISQINFYCYVLFSKRKRRKNVYYSGYFDNKDFFYETSYKEFQQRLLLEYTAYQNFIKIDIEDFYKNISLKRLQMMKVLEIDKILILLKRLNLDEFPILEDCAGLSYIATDIYLEELDKELEHYFSTVFTTFETIRCSDDLYIFFNGEYVEEDILKDLKKIYAVFNLKINEKKYVYDSTDNLPNHVSGKLYDLFYYSEDFDLFEIIGSEEEIKCLIKNFIKKISKIKNFDEYKNIVENDFEINYGREFKKNIFDEIIYNPRINCLINQINISNIISKQKMVEILKFDPIRLTVLFLYYRQDEYPTHILYSIYRSIEKENISNAELLILFTYYTQRVVQENTRIKIIEKLKKTFPELSHYLLTYA